MNQEELEGRVKTCVDFLTQAFDKTRLEIETKNSPNSGIGLANVD